MDPDDAPTELAIPTFPVQADLSDTVDTGGMIPPTSQPLVEDATMVDRPLFDHAHTPSSSPIAPGDNRDRAVAGGELEIPRTDGPRGPRVEPIAPGSNRDRAAVGGSVSVPSQPAMHIPEMEDISRVSVEGIDDGQATGYFRRQDPGPAPVQPAQGKGQESTWSQVVTEKRRRFSSTQIIVFAASLTLIVVGIIAVLTLLPGKKGRSSGGVEGGGSLVVTTKPPAACTISLDKAAKGLLSPGAAVSLADIKEGGHRIAVTCVGFIPFAADVKVARGEVTVLEAKLVKDKK